MTDTLRVLIVDDEPPARDRLRRLLGELDGLAIVGEAANGVEAVDAVNDLEPDIVLLDIRMPAMDGIEAARHIATLTTPPAIVFTTAFDQYAIDAFDAQAVGYLLKPVRRSRLEKAIAQARRLTRPQLGALGAVSQSTGREHICARTGDRLKLIPVADVLFFRADQKYTTVRHRGGEDIIDDSLKALEEEFADDFVRIHRNALIAVRSLRALEKTDSGYLAILHGCDDKLTVSRRLAAELRRRVRGHGGD